MSELFLLLFISSPLVLLIIIFVMWRKLKRLKHSSLSIPPSNAEFVETLSYKRKYRFRSSFRYKQKITELNAIQSEMRKNQTAIKSSADWVVGMDKQADKKGQSLMKGIATIMLQAFDKECDLIIDNVNFRNFDNSKIKIEKQFSAINKSIAISQLEITEKYLELKIQMLHATFEHDRLEQEEKEKLAAIREEEKEQARLEREALAAQRKAELEQKRVEKEIAEAKKRLAKDKENAQLKALIAQLQQDLQQAIEDGKRAISMAQQTKAGVVYVISNIGSFGENVYKIGMTRRLEPMERVKELGDASVPFPFDVHALIRTDDAPKLEWSLHKKFANKQVNRVNARKEFFEVSLEDIVKEVKKMGLSVEFTMAAEADEYYQSLAMKKENRFNDINENDIHNDIEDENE